MNHSFYTVFASPLLALVISISLSAPAHASGGFPSAMKSHLGASATPSCTGCHTSNGGGMGTITKPFGEAMQAAGLVAGNNSSLTAALDQLDADGTDSDNDGATDIEELKAGTDPNAVDTTGDAAPSPSYGFFGCTAAGGAPVAVALLFALRRRRQPNVS